MKTHLSNSGDSQPTITRIHANAVEVQNCLLLDVRTPAEYEQAHIEGSVLKPLSSLLSADIASLVAEKSNCVVVCQSGNRARQAAEKLISAGISQVQVLDGGIAGWQSAGLPLKYGKAMISLERQVRIAAGLLVLVGALLGYFIHPAWITLSAFVGAGLVFAGITNTCGMGLFLARMPWNNRKKVSPSSCCLR